MSVNAGMWDMSSSGGSASGSASGSGSPEALTCAARSIQGPIQLPVHPIATLIVRSFLILFFMTVSFLGTVLNIFVVYLVWRFKSLRTKEFSFAIQITVINIFSSAFLVSLMLTTVVANQWLFGEYMCVIAGVLVYGLGTLRGLLMLAFATDRFFNVFMPFKYPKYRAKVLVAQLVVIYLVSLIALVLPGLYDCESLSVTSYICRINPNCHPPCSIMRQLFGLALFAPSSILPVVLYIALLCKAKRANQSNVPEASQIQNADQAQKSGRRAAITFFLMFVTFFLVSFPPGVLSVLVVGNAGMPQNTLWLYIVDSVALNTFILSFVADPIFILRNRDVRDVLPQVTWLPPFWYFKYD